jgi:hypothetical protein
MAQTYRIPLAVAAGLNLYDEVSALTPGQLVMARNKASGVWGARHGSTYIDDTNRGRANPSLNGTTAFIGFRHNPGQWDLGTTFTIWILFKLLARPSADNGWILTTNHAADKSIDIWMSTAGIISVYIEDSDGTNDTLVATSAASANDIVALGLTRDADGVDLYYGTAIEDTSTALGATKGMNVVVQRRHFGKPPSYAGGSPEYLNAIFGGLYIFTSKITSRRHIYSELPFPRADDVTGAWTGEMIEGDDYVFDASRWACHALNTNESQGTRIPEVIEPVQAIQSVTMRDGRRYNVVAVGGRIFAEAL